MSTLPPTATPLELAVDTAAMALLAYAYPSDVEVRERVMRAAASQKGDYIEALFAIMEHNPAISADAARLHLALHYVELVQVAARGAQPRPGILCTGKRADELGRDPDRVRQTEDDDDEYDAV